MKRQMITLITVVETVKKLIDLKTFIVYFYCKIVNSYLLDLYTNIMKLLKRLVGRFT